MELHFKSSLSEEEVEENFKDFNLAESLESSLLEMLDYKLAQRTDKEQDCEPK